MYFTMMKKHKLFISLITALAIAGISIVPAFAYDANDIYNLLNNTTNSYLNNIKNSNGNIESYSNSIRQTMNQYLPTLNTISSQFTTLNTSVNTLNTNVNTIRLGLSDWYTSYNTYIPKIDTNVQQLTDVLANSTDSAIRSDYESRVSEVSNDFLSSSGDASVSLNDIGSSKQSVTALKDSLSGGVSASSLWSVLTSSSEGWGWFSQATMNDLDQTGSGNRRLTPEYEYLNDYYAQVMNSLGGEYND